MTVKTLQITGWILSGIAGGMLGASAIDKIFASAHASQMGASFGLQTGTYSLLGIIEIVSAMLFLYPARAFSEPCYCPPIWAAPLLPICNTSRISFSLC